MSEPTILTWSPANWLTVVLMVTLAFFILGMIVKIVRQRREQMAA